jgi:hypothetical protein
MILENVHCSTVSVTPCDLRSGHSALLQLAEEIELTHAVNFAAAEFLHREIPLWGLFVRQDTHVHPSDVTKGTSTPGAAEVWRKPTHDPQRSGYHSSSKKPIYTRVTCFHECYLDWLVLNQLRLAVKIHLTNELTVSELDFLKSSGHLMDAVNEWAVTDQIKI